MVTLANVGRNYQGRRSPAWALRDVSLSIPAGQFVAVMGATGSGKSTLLHCAAGLDRPDTGQVWLAGTEIGRMGERRLTKLRRDKVGFVFQAYNLLSELTVAQNVLLPSRLGGPGAKRDDVARVLGIVAVEAAIVLVTALVLACAVGGLTLAPMLHTQFHTWLPYLPPFYLAGGIAVAAMVVAVGMLVPAAVLTRRRAIAVVGATE